MTTNADKTVYVGLSGGVDSSVSAALLKDAGYDVTGVFIKVWHPPFLQCDWKKERRDAMRVCAHLDIPFKTIDLSEEYKREVVDYMIEEYKAGRTPNPDVMCNKQIKFGAFYDAAREMGADYVATGHYARLRREAPNSKFKIQNSHLLIAKDEHKDQTYFLWTLTQEKLRHTLFPVGDREKSVVRDIAKKRGLFTATKDDSQGLCFLGDVDMEDFLGRFIELQEGAVLNMNGEQIGTHRGAIIYTIGQRHGFEVTKKNPDDGPWYVAKKDVNENTITVTQEKEEVDSPLYNGKIIRLEDTNWIAGHMPSQDSTYRARIRYNQPLEPCTIENHGGAVHVVFDEPQRAVARGQSLVLYDDEKCLGGGIIARAKTGEFENIAKKESMDKTSLQVG